MEQGYKQSPLGPIPEDWEVKRLGEICTHFKSGITITSKDIHEDGLYPVYGGNGLRGYANTFTHDGSYILIGRQGALCGNVNYVDGKNYISEHAIAVQTNENMQWLKYKLENWNLNRFSESSAQPGLSVEKLVRYKLSVPTLKEQNKIADILSLWDTAIEKQTALIEKLTLRKRGLMQQLLTGKKRLEGFSGEWKEVRLGEMAMLVGGGTPTTKNTNYWNGNILWISSSDLKDDDLRISGTRFITEEAIVNSTTQLLPTKSILIVTRVGVGKVAIAEQPTCVSQDFTCLIKYEAETNFLAYYLLQLMKKKKNQSQGTSIKGISVDEISKICIYLPTKIEQVAIASVLVNADKEIEIQKQKLAAMQEQKKGLMQVLLTGKKRVH